jgi:hypothetical protein
MGGSIGHDDIPRLSTINLNEERRRTRSCPLSTVALRKRVNRKAAS